MIPATRKKKKKRYVKARKGRRFIWLSYDLGLQGDYEGLYTWLAKRRAKECGEGLALLSYPRGRTVDAFIVMLKASLRRSVKWDERARAYVIYSDDGGSAKGRWLMGGRRAAPWASYSPSQKTASEDASNP